MRAIALRPAALALILALAAALPARPDAAADLAEAERLLAGAEGRADRKRALAQAIRAYERAVAGLAASGADIAAREREAARALAAEEARMRPLLAALARLGMAAEPAILLSATAPDDAVRASLALDSAARRLGTGRDRLKRTRDALAGLRAEQAELLARLRQGEAGLRAARLDLIETVAPEADGLPDIPDIGADVATLTALAIALETLSPGDAAALPGDLSFAAPVPGRLLRPFGAADPAGLERPGITVEAAPGTLVTSPAPASVRYAGRLDSYGPVVILEPAPDMLILMAGLGGLLVRPGAALDTGDPVGFLPAAIRPVGESHEDFSQTGADASGILPSKPLYIELRHDGSPVDPTDRFPYDSKELAR